MKYATFVEIIIQRFGQYVNNVYLCRIVTQVTGVCHRDW